MKAIIDLGTNTFHLLIAEIRNEQISEVFNMQAPVKLGEGGIGNDTLSNDAMQRGLTALGQFKTYLDRFEVQQVTALATSAIRNAKNGKEFVDGFHQGITVTCPGFYGPQGRVLRMGLTQPQLIDRLTTFTFGQHRISNFEMETSAIYGMGKVLGHHCLSLSAIVANRITKEFSSDGGAAVENLIKKTLEVISNSK